MKEDLVLVINDIPSLGRAAAAINLPILNAAQYQVAVVPTLLLSTHTGYTGFKVQPVDQAFFDFIDHILEQNINVQCLLTGYFATSEQVHDFIAKLETIKKGHDSLEIYSDPIMADDGKLYTGFESDMVEAMKQLAGHSTIITPNITEAYLMADMNYQENPNQDQLRKLADKLHSLGTPTVIITGIRKADRIGFYVSEKDKPAYTVMHQYYDAQYCGTGDVALSLLVAFHQAGYSIKGALEASGDLLELALEASFKQKRTFNEGIYFEEIMPYVAERLKAGEG